MALQKNTRVIFERIALEAVLREHPGDRVAADALIDWLQEHGATRMTAGRLVTRVVREATEAMRIRRVLVKLSEDSHHSRHLLGRIRQRLRLTAEVVVMFRVSPGWATPEITADNGEFRNAAGVAVSEFELAAGNGLGWTWHVTRVMVAVGAAWVEAGCPTGRWTGRRA